MFCTSCANEIPLGVAKCPNCGTAAEDLAIATDRPRASEPPINAGDSIRTQRKSPRFDALTSRYADAYKAARFIVGLGKVVKLLSIIIAVLFLIGAGGFALIVGLALLSQAEKNPMAFYTAGPVFWASILIAFWAAIIGFFGYLMGVFVSAAGQIQRATLDTAVNSSPHLTNDEKASIMSLP